MLRHIMTLSITYSHCSIVGNKTFSTSTIHSWWVENAHIFTVSKHQQGLKIEYDQNHPLAGLFDV